MKLCRRQNKYVLLIYDLRRTRAFVCKQRSIRCRSFHAPVSVTQCRILLAHLGRTVLVKRHRVVLPLNPKWENIREYFHSSLPKSIYSGIYIFIVFICLHLFDTNRIYLPYLFSDSCVTLLFL